MSSIIIGGYFDSLENVRKKADSIPYENFPFCCSSDNSLKREVDIARMQNILPKKKPPPKARSPKIIVVEPKKPVTFWTAPIIERYSNIKSTYSCVELYHNDGQVSYGN